MISRKYFTTTKVLVGVALATLASVHYATAFAQMHPAVLVGGTALCFMLLTLPMWLALADKPLNNIAAYYLLALAVLVGLTFGRFPLRALFFP
jgi:hypothetical protein